VSPLILSTGRRDKELTGPLDGVCYHLDGWQLRVDLRDGAGQNDWEFDSAPLLEGSRTDGDLAAIDQHAANILILRT